MALYNENERHTFVECARFGNNHREMFQCFNHDIGTLGEEWVPCSMTCTHSAYREHVQRGRSRGDQYLNTEEAIDRLADGPTREIVCHRCPMRKQLMQGQYPFNGSCEREDIAFICGASDLEHDNPYTYQELHDIGRFEHCPIAKRRDATGNRHILERYLSKQDNSLLGSMRDVICREWIQKVFDHAVADGKIELSSNVSNSIMWTKTDPDDYDYLLIGWKKTAPNSSLLEDEEQIYRVNKDEFDKF